MAGIYIHIPFCKQACNYCNFHFSTLLKYKGKLVDAIGKEIFLRKDFLKAEPIETIYFGGGTPSILTEAELNFIFESLYKNFDLTGLKEITLEANPDDLSHVYLKFLQNTPVNRLSIGVQSFIEDDLRWMNRAHHAIEAKESILNAQDFGFSNINIDLIYGSPGLSNSNWENNLQTAFLLNVKHISSYGLTVEPKTALANMIKKAAQPLIDEMKTEAQFGILMDKMAENDFEHYEISNFAKSGHYALHNTNYWRGKHYLGIGPGAHSFVDHTRSWNIANNQIYIHKIELNADIVVYETLNENDIFNEFIMTGLRTQWGCNRKEIRLKFGEKILKYVDKELQKEVAKETVVLQGDAYILTRKGKYFADGIASNLFILD